MMKIVFSEEFINRDNFYPFTLTRHVHGLRTGILTIKEKWERLLKMEAFEQPLHFLSTLVGKDFTIIASNTIPTLQLARKILKLKINESLIDVNGKVIATRKPLQIEKEKKNTSTYEVFFKEVVNYIEWPWHIFQFAKAFIELDIYLLRGNRKSQRLPKGVIAEKPHDIFIEKGAVVKPCIVNASTGPVYIGKNAEVMEGVIIRGPFAMAENSCLKMGAKIYGPVAIGQKSVVGGEVKNSILFAFSNKAHDGYLGDAVIGEWCNLGAGTTNSNIKNSAADVKVATLSGEVIVGQKCGVLMGDYSKTAINTSINTGTVVGTCANVFGPGLTPKHIPSFTWGCDGNNRYELEKAVTHIRNWMQLKNQEISDEQLDILKYIYSNP